MDRVVSIPQASVQANEGLLSLMYRAAPAHNELQRVFVNVPQAGSITAREISARLVAAEEAVQNGGRAVALSQETSSLDVILQGIRSFMGRCYGLSTAEICVMPVPMATSLVIGIAGYALQSTLENRGHANIGRYVGLSSFIGAGLMFGSSICPLGRAGTAVGGILGGVLWQSLQGLRGPPEPNFDVRG